MITPRGADLLLLALERNPEPPKVLLVAGDRESVWPGIGERTERLLVGVFGMLADGR